MCIFIYTHTFAKPCYTSEKPQSILILLSDSATKSYRFFWHVVPSLLITGITELLGKGQELYRLRSHKEPQQ